MERRDRGFIKLCLIGLLAAGLLLGGALTAMAQRELDNLQFIGPAVQRPLSDFLDVQGTFCYPDGLGGCLIFNPPLPNYLDWRDPIDSRNRVAAVDYAGLAARYVLENFGLDFGTEVSGTVTERPLADGRALVRVTLVTTNAFTWVVSGTDTFTSPVIFGNRIDEVLFNGAEPALGDCTFQIDFFNDFPGAPLPDLIQMLAFPENGGIGLRSLAFTVSALGELHATFGVPEGTPGMATITMLNNQHNGPGPNVPVENILVRALGKKGP